LFKKLSSLNSSFNGSEKSRMSRAERILARNRSLEAKSRHNDAT